MGRKKIGRGDDQTGCDGRKNGFGKKGQILNTHTPMLGQNVVEIAGQKNGRMCLLVEKIPQIEAVKSKKKTLE